MASRTVRRRLGLGLLLLVALVIYLIVATGKKHFVVSGLLPDAGQLVKGNQVRVGGSPVGIVKEVALNNDGRAKITLDVTEKDLIPLRKGTRMIVRNSSLSAVAGRFVSLEPGPSNAPAMRDGDQIPSTDTRPITDIDLVLNAVDEEGRRYLSQVVKGGSQAVDGAGPALNRTLKRLYPAFRNTRSIIDELVASEPDLERLLSQSAILAKTINSNRSALDQGLVGSATTLRAVANRRKELGDTLARAPALLKRANTTLVNSRLLIKDSTPLLEDLRPVSPRLASFIKSLKPLSEESIPLVQDIRRTLPPLKASIPQLPKIGRRVGPALKDSAVALNKLAPIYRGLRMYIPDVISGLGVGFAGKAGGYYDANGHMAQIQPVLNGDGFVDSLLGLGDQQPEVRNLLQTLLGTNGALRPLLKELQVTGNNSYSTATNRCPGGASQPLADGSGPWAAGGDGTCDPTQVLPGGKFPVKAREESK